MIIILYNVIVLELFIIFLLSKTIKLLWINFQKQSSNLFSFKINNFYLNKVIIIVYLALFVIFFNYLRMKRFDFELDLKEIINFSTYWNSLLPLQRFNFPLLLSMFFLVILIIFLLLINIQKLLIKEIKKLHLYYEFTKDVNGVAIFSTYYLIIIDKAMHYNFYKVSSFLIGNLKKIIYNINPQWRHYSNTITRIILLFLKTLPFIIMIILLIWDCYFNNFKLTKIFSFMVLVIPYFLWYRITTFIWHEAPPYNAILYEMYYSKDQFMIVNAPQYIENKLIQYVKNGLYHKFSGEVSCDAIQEKESSALEDRQFLLTHHSFFSVDGKHYKNSDGQYFIESDT